MTSASVSAHSPGCDECVSYGVQANRAPGCHRQSKVNLTEPSRLESVSRRGAPVAGDRSFAVIASRRMTCMRVRTWRQSLWWRSITSPAFSALAPRAAVERARRRRATYPRYLSERGHCGDCGDCGAPQQTAMLGGGHIESSAQAPRAPRVDWDVAYPRGQRRGVTARDVRSSSATDTGGSNRPADRSRAPTPRAPSRVSAASPPRGRSRGARCRGHTYLAYFGASACESNRAVRLPYILVERHSAEILCTRYHRW